jgi:protein required for attachment to host cells
MTDSTIAQRSADKSRHSVGQPTTGSDYQPNLTPHQVEARKFAQEVVTFLDEAHNAGRFDKLCVVASPEFMGLLREKLATRMGKVETVEVTKDYTRDSAQQLRERLAEQLRPH